MKFQAAEIIRFTYRHHAGATPDEPQDNFKEVLVLHPNWAGKLHGIDLKRLTMAEREVLSAVFDPNQKGKPHRLPMVNDVLRRMDPLDEIKNPMSFYSKFVKVFLRNKDAYRTYYPQHMLNATVVQQTNVAGKLTNPKPLFAPVESKAQPAKTTGPTPTAPAKPAAAPTKQSRMDLIRARAKAMKDKGEL